MEFQQVLPRYGEAFLRLFYPCLCAICNRLLELEERGLCLPCRGSFLKLRFLPSEERIRIPLVAGDEAWSLFRYEGPVKEVFHKIKFERRRDLLQVFAGEMNSFFARRPHLATYDCVIAIPLDSRRRLEREFNQSEVLAAMARKTLGKRSAGAVFKKCPTVPQSLLGREARKLNLDRAFRIPHPRRVRGRSFLLVDDIFTTGATLQEAAGALKGAGASRVGFLVIARTMSH